MITVNGNVIVKVIGRIELALANLHYGSYSYTSLAAADTGTVPGAS